MNWRGTIHECSATHYAALDFGNLLFREREDLASGQQSCHSTRNRCSQGFPTLGFGFSGACAVSNGLPFLTAFAGG